MDEVEKIARQFHESWDLRDPDRGALVIAPDNAARIAVYREIRETGFGLGTNFRKPSTNMTEAGRFGAAMMSACNATN